MTFRRLPSVLLALLAALVFPAASSAEQVVSKSGPHAMASSSVAPTPSARTIARARVAGLPAVDPAARISGPFDGPEGTLYYLDRDSHISYFHPEGATAYFGDLADDGSVHFRYGLNISGQYVFSTDGQVQQVRVLPDDVYRWPHAEAIAQVLIQHVQQILQGQSTLQTVDWAAASAASRAMHDTNMAILQGMRADACTEHYDGVYYLGCW